MTLINNIACSLSKSKTQRICYVAALILWVLIWLDDLDIYNLVSFLRIKYIWLMTIPTTLLVVQIIFNNTLIWATIWGIIILYSAWTIYENALNFEPRFILGFILVTSILFAIN